MNYKITNPYWSSLLLMTSIKKKIKYSFKNSLVSVDRIKKSSSPYIVMSQKIVKVQICQGKDYNPHNIKYPLADDTI